MKDIKGTKTEQNLREAYAGSADFPGGQTLSQE